MSGADGARTMIAELAEFNVGVSYDGLPDALAAETKVRLLDAIAVSFAGWDSPGTTKALAVGRGGLLGEGKATLWLGGVGLPPDQAAFLNSVVIHSITHEDGGPGGHPSANAVPAAVALAESSGASGPDLLAAIAAGYEVQARMAEGGLMAALEHRGMRGTIVTGSFGAAAAAARAMGLDAATTADALAFAAAIAVPGIEHPILEALTDERWLTLAADTRAGASAAILAAAGFEGSKTALEGECGFYEVYLGRPGRVEEVTDGLGERWCSAANTTRPYPTGGANIGTVYATEKLVQGNAIDAAEIERVDVLHPWWRRNTAYAYPGPFTSFEQALLSAGFAVACVVLEGKMDWPTVQKLIDDPRALELSRKVRVEGVATWGLHDGDVAITLTDGRVLR
ncbi:MAG TPA: MmgE/PrpD family protein, partial [Solirubrobacterales bacterium]|nr:MmgE/PrpD family protein [Solirubrobacterales bacterium]